MMIHGRLEKAAFEVLAAAPVTAVVQGRFFYNTVSNAVEVHNGTTWKTLMYVGGSHTTLADIGTLTHAELDDVATSYAAHIANVSNPHSVTKTQVGLGNVDNTSDATKNSAVATLTNKTLTSPTLTTPVIDDYMDVNEESAPATPSAGKLRVYAKSDKKLYTKNSDGTESAVGSGAGEKTYIAGASTAAGWTAVGDLAVATSTTAAELPREHTTGSGIKITADADTQSTADYVYFDFTLDDVDLSKKLKIQWAQKTTGTYAAGDLAVVITTQADRTTALHTPITTAIPAVDGVFTTSFDASTTATLSLVIRATTDMATNGGVVISDVIVGPGIQPQGAVVGAPVTFSPTLGGVTTDGTVAYNAGFTSGDYTRRGQTMRMVGNVIVSSVTAAPTGELTLKIPGGLTRDLALASNSGASCYKRLGSGHFYDSSAAAFVPVFFRAAGAGPDEVTISAATAVAVPALQANDELYFDVEIPIAEWAGSGTVNLAQNDVEYAYNSDVTATASVTASGYAYGATGGQFGAAWAVGTNWTRRVQFQTPLQPSDKLELEFSADSGATWQAFGTNPNASALTTQSGTNYGASVSPVSVTAADVFFRTGGRLANSATYGNNGSPWSDLTGGTYRWRVKKVSGGQAVGFGAATATASGLVSLEDSGTFTAHLYGATSNSFAAASSTGSVTAYYSKVGKTITITCPNIRASSNSTHLWIGGIPSDLAAATFSYFPIAIDAGAGSIGAGYIDTSDADTGSNLAFQLHQAGISSAFSGTVQTKGCFAFSITYRGV